MTVTELRDELDIEFISAKKGMNPRHMPTEEETHDLITSALTKLMLDELAENESLDINIVRETLLNTFNKVMEPNYTVRSILQSNGTISLRVEGYSTFNLDKLKELVDDRS